MGTFKNLVSLVHAAAAEVMVGICRFPKTEQTQGPAKTHRVILQTI